MTTATKAYSVNSSGSYPIEVIKEDQAFTSQSNGWWGQTVTSQYTTSDPRCGERTNDGGRCSLTPSFGDDCCHWHTSEQCYRPTTDDTPCELPGSRTDGACHIHTSGCNESLTHNGVQKAAFHSIKGAYRWLGLHSDMIGDFDIQPEPAAIIAAQAGRAYLQSVDEPYDRERSLKDLESKHISGGGVIQKLIDWLRSGFESPGDDYSEAGVLSVDELQSALKRAWKKTNKRNHKAGARVAVAAGEAFLGQKVEVET